MQFSLLYSKKVKAMIQRKYNMEIHDTADILGDLISLKPQGCC